MTENGDRNAPMGCGLFAALASPFLLWSCWQDHARKTAEFDPETAIEATVWTVFDEFEANEVAAKQKYGEHSIFVAVKIGRVEEAGPAVVIADWNFDDKHEIRLNVVSEVVAISLKPRMEGVFECVGARKELLSLTFDACSYFIPYGPDYIKIREARRAAARQD